MGALSVMLLNSCNPENVMCLCNACCFVVCLVFIVLILAA